MESETSVSEGGARSVGVTEHPEGLAGRRRVHRDPRRRLAGHVSCVLQSVVVMFTREAEFGVPEPATVDPKTEPRAPGREGR